MLKPLFSSLSFAASGFIAMTIVSVLGFTASVYAAPETCADFKLKRNNDSRKVQFVDHGAEGVSVGDQRIGYLRLQDENGTDVGELRWIATVVEVDESSGDAKTSSQNFISLPGGVIHSVRPAESVMTSAQSETERNTSGDHFIIGGSGIFANATGTMSRIANDVHEFRVSCD